jgi:ABC-type sulfate transport system substrate-binding protein
MVATKKKCMQVQQVIDFLSEFPGNTPVYTNWEDEGLLIRVVENKHGETLISFEEADDTVSQSRGRHGRQAESVIDDDDFDMSPLGVPTLDLDESDDDDSDDDDY